jgi:tRNA (cytidine/uridine-2'-O-)-methyltransferase
MPITLGARGTMLNLVLYAPRIPQNTGQIARACLAMNCRLHLVRPLGFRVDAPALARASVGYLKEVDLTVHADGEAFWSAVADPARAWLVTKFGRRAYTEVNFAADDWLVFGNETEGLPADWLARRPGQTIRIPMLNPRARCLNLATAASVVMFEALRQVADSAWGNEQDRQSAFAADQPGTPAIRKAALPDEIT